MPVDERFAKIELDYEKLEARIDLLERKFEEEKWNMGRITSDIQSEVGLARRDLGRIETRLFGPEDAEYGGKIGHVNRRVYRMEVWFLAVISATGIILTAYAIYQVFAP